MIPKKLPFDPNLLDRMYTKMQYAKDFNVSRPTIDKRIKKGELLCFEIKGTQIILSNAA